MIELSSRQSDRLRKHYEDLLGAYRIKLEDKEDTEARIIINFIKTVLIKPLDPEQERKANLRPYQ